MSSTLNWISWCNRSTFFSVNARFLLALGLSVPGFPFPIEAFGRNPLDPARASGPIRATCRCSSPFLRPGPSASVAWAPVSRPRNTSDQGGRPSRAKRCRAARAATARRASHPTERVSDHTRRAPRARGQGSTASPFWSDGRRPRHKRCQGSSQGVAPAESLRGKPSVVRAVVSRHGGARWPRVVSVRRGTEARRAVAQYGNHRRWRQPHSPLHMPCRLCSL